MEAKGSVQNEQPPPSSQQTCAVRTQVSRFQSLIGLAIVPLCEDCYAREYPERAATFALRRLDPCAPEFRDPALAQRD